MKAFLDEHDNLVILVTTESIEDLIGVTSLKEVIDIYLPALKPTTVDVQTNAPVYEFQGSMWWLPDYLTVDPIETLRDTGMLTLRVVK